MAVVRTALVLIAAAFAAPICESGEPIADPLGSANNISVLTADRQRNLHGDRAVTTASAVSTTLADADLTAGRLCRLTTTDPYVHRTVVQKLAEKVTLIEYQLSFANYSRNPLTINVAGDSATFCTTEL